MNDSPPNTNAAASDNTLCDAKAHRDTDRNRLIDDLAFLIVRQHRRQQHVEHETDLTMGCVKPETKEM